MAEIQSATVTASALSMRDGLTDVGNQEILRLNRGTGGSVQPVGYSASWIKDPDTGFIKKVFVKHLLTEQTPEWNREWFLDLDPIQFERRWPKKQDQQPDHVEIGFYIENLIQHTNLLTTKGSKVGGTPDETALLAVTIDFVQNLNNRLDEALERIATLEAA